MRNSVGKSTLLITASKLASLGINMACVMVLSRIRTLDEYGTYSQLLLAINLVSMLFIMGLPNSINYFLAREESAEGKRTYLSHYFTLNLLLSAFAGVVLFLGVPVLERYFHNDVIGTYSFFLLLYPFASITMSAVESVLVVYERPRTLVLYRLLNSLSLLGILVAADALGMTFRQYMVLFLLTELLFALAVYVIAGRLAGGLQLAFSAAKLREIAVFCIPIGLASAVGTLSAELDKLVISAFFSNSDYAIYTNAAKELPLTVLSSATTMVIMPKIVRHLHRGEAERAISMWKDAFVLNYAVMAVMVFGIVTYAPEVITILYSEKYLPGVTVFRTYTLILLLRTTYFGIILNATGNTKYIFRISVAQLCVNVVLNLIGCRWLGLIGPAAATVIATFWGAYRLLRATAHELAVPISSLLPIRALAGLTAINFTIALLFAGLKVVLPLDTALAHICTELLAGRNAASIGQCGESVLLGLVWVLLYAVLMYRPLRRKWDTMNQAGE